MHNKVLFFGALVGLALAANGIIGASEAGFPGALFPLLEGIQAVERSPQLPPVVLTRSQSSSNPLYPSKSCV